MGAEEEMRSEGEQKNTKGEEDRSEVKPWGREE